MTWDNLYYIYLLFIVYFIYITIVNVNVVNLFAIKLNSFVQVYDTIEEV